MSAVIGVIAAMQVEIEAIVELLEDAEQITSGKLLFTRGKIAGQSVVVTDSGVGPVNAAIVTQQLIDRFSVDRILHTGIAGGLADDLAPQSVILGDSLAYHDFDAAILEQFSPYTSVFHADPEMLEQAKAALPESMHARVGRIVSGNKFVSDSQLKKMILDTVGGLCVDMESAAVAHCATVNEIPFLVIRAVSDMADEAADDSYEMNKTLSARVAASVVLALVHHLDALDTKQ